MTNFLFIMRAKRVSISTATAENKKSGFIIENESTSIMIDPPSVIIDSKIDLNHIRTSEYIEIEVMKEYPPNLSGIFITNSNSLCVFFVDSNVPIYLTDVVYLQMKERLKYYLSLGPVSWAKRAPQAGTKIVPISSYRKIGRRVNIVKFNQIVNFTYFSVVPQPAGTSLGWLTCKIVQGGECVCVYAYGVPGGCSLAQEMKEQKEKTPLLVNRLMSKDKPGIQDLTKDILGLSEKKKPFVITMDVLNHSMEISLHVLSLVKEANVFISHPGFKKIRQMYEMKRDLFSNRFMADSSIISTLFSTERVQVSSPKKILKLKKKDKAVIFCDPTQYTLFYKKMSAIHLKNYSVRFMGDLAEVLSIPWASRVYMDVKLLNEEERKEVKNISTRNYIGISKEANHRIRICDTENIHRISTADGKYSFHFTGRITEELGGLLLRCKEPPLKEIVNNQYAEYVIGDSLIYTVKDKVFKVTEKTGQVDVQWADQIDTQRMDRIENREISNGWSG